MELKRQESLSISIQRIEESLSARKIATEASQKHELEVLSKKLIDQQEDHESEVRRLEEQQKDQDIRLKAAHDARDKAERDCVQIQKKLVDTTAIVKEQAEKIALLESKLCAPEKHPGGDDLTADLRMQVESLAESLKSAEQKNLNLEKQITLLKEVSKGSEDAVIEMSNALKVAKSSNTNEVSVLEGQLKVATTELERMKQVVADLTSDLSIQREERERALEDGKLRLAEAESQIDTFRGDAENARMEAKQLNSEIGQLKMDVATAQVCTAC